MSTRRAFTLLEILLAIALMGLIAAVLVTGGAQGVAEDAARRLERRLIEDGCHAYLVEVDNLRHGLASDVGGGTSFSPFHTLHAAYTVARQSVGRPGVQLSPERLWWLHTAGAALWVMGLVWLWMSLRDNSQTDQLTPKR